MENVFTTRYGPDNNEFHISSGSVDPSVVPSILFSGSVSSALGLFLQDLDEFQTLEMLHNGDLDSPTLLGEKLSLKSRVEIICNAM